MKKIVAFIVFSFWCQLGFAQNGRQVVGLHAGGYVSGEGMFANPDNQNSLLSQTAGGFYSRNLGQRFSFSGSALYRSAREIGTTYCNNCIYFTPTTYKLSYSYLELPVALAYSLSKKNDQGWKSYVSVGYTYSWLMKLKQTDLVTKQVDYLRTGTVHRNGNSEFINLGLEFRHPYGNGLMLSVNPQVRFLLGDVTQAYDLGVMFRIGKKL